VEGRVDLESMFHATCMKTEIKIRIAAVIDIVLTKQNGTPLKGVPE
jgi:hypothetical protein